jgi:hypothetical protein
MSEGGREHSKRTPMDFYLSQCVDKIKHDRTTAKREALRMSKIHRRVFRAYYCTFCCQWHVGKTKQPYKNRYSRRQVSNDLYRR